MSANQDDATASQDTGLDSEIVKQEEKPVDAGELKRQLEHSQRLLKETEDAREFWYTKANTKPEPAERQAKPQEPAEEEDYSLVDIVTENDKGKLQKVIAREAAKIVRDTLKSGGYISKAEAEQLVTGTVTEVQASERLIQDFPDLQEAESKLYRETARQLEMLDRNPAYSAVPQVDKARMAATTAENMLYRSGKMDAKPRQSREERIAAQQGGGRGSREGERESSELTPSQKHWAKEMGLTDEQYRAGQKITHIVGYGTRR